MHGYEDNISNWVRVAGGVAIIQSLVFCDNFTKYSLLRIGFHLRWKRHNSCRKSNIKKSVPTSDKNKFVTI